MKNKFGLLAGDELFRNMLNAIFCDDPVFKIYKVNEPLPDGTIVKREDGKTLNIVCSDVAKLCILKDHIGDVYNCGRNLYIDYYFGKPDKCTKDFTRPNTALDIKVLFEGNPHFSDMYSGFAPFGTWFSIAFKPELIQYHSGDASTLHGFTSCAMETIARRVFYNDVKKNRIFFGTEMLEDMKLGSKKNPRGKYVLYTIPEPKAGKVYYCGGLKFTSNIEKAYHYMTPDEAKEDKTIIEGFGKDLDIQLEELK